MIRRTIRVLNEIESRLQELREELEEEGSGGDQGRQGGGGRGQVTHPETDRRLKANRDD